MNELINNTNLTMSSREIAELTDTRHDSVMRTIENLNMKGLLECPQFVETQNEQNKQFYTISNLQKTDCLVLIARLSPEFMKAVVDRWQELESKQLQPALPANYIEALESLIVSEKEKSVLSEQLQIAKPAVEFVEKYTQADSGSKGFRQVAKLLNLKESVFRAFLVDHKIMYRLAGEWTAYANHIEANRFEVKTGEHNNHIHNATLFTAKGIEWITGLIALEEEK